MRKSCLACICMFLTIVLLPTRGEKWFFPPSQFFFIFNWIRADKQNEKERDGCAQQRHLKQLSIHLCWLATDYPFFLSPFLLFALTRSSKKRVSSGSSSWWLLLHHAKLLPAAAAFLSRPLFLSSWLQGLRVPEKISWSVSDFFPAQKALVWRENPQLEEKLFYLLMVRLFTLVWDCLLWLCWSVSSVSLPCLTDVIFRNLFQDVGPETPCLFWIPFHVLSIKLRPDWNIHEHYFFTFLNFVTVHVSFLFQVRRDSSVKGSVNFCGRLAINWWHWYHSIPKV